MAIYIIGDVHGCFDQLQAILNKIAFNEREDQLWFTGDLVNGGPKPIETLEFIKNLGNQSITVLGNHDLTLLGIAAKEIKNTQDRKIGFESILQSNKKIELLNWLQNCPLVHYNQEHNILLVHAGLAASWDLEQAINLSKEVEVILKSNQANILYRNLHSNPPINKWNDDLIGLPRLLCIINYMTQARFCTKAGTLDFSHKGTIATAPKHLIPWYAVPDRKTSNIRIAFGHWAALQGETGYTNAIALDTGCVWGNYLTAWRINDNAKFQVKGVS